MTVRVKICGLTNTADAQAAVLAGADMLGFIFYPKSPRFVSPEQVQLILKEVGLMDRPVLRVGVFVNETLEEIIRVLDSCGLDLAQLHGDEPPEMLGRYPAQANRLTGRAYKALRPRSEEEAALGASRYALPERGRLPAFLLDAYQPHQLGGTGKTGDWSIAAKLARSYAVMLAGGLTPGTIQQAIQTVQPWGVDVSSGVEASPGKKDHTALQEFIQAAKE